MKRTSPIGFVHTYSYGTAEIVRFEGAWRLHVYRPFAVHPKEPWNAAVTERVMCVGPSDASPMRSTYPTGYDSKCSCCYLNISHTDDKHAQCLGT